MISFKTYYDSHSGRVARFSKNYSVRKAVQVSTTFEGRVKLFEDYYSGWFLIPLEKNLREGTALITTTVLFSLCDVMEQFKRGQQSENNTTAEFVKSVLTDIYGNDVTRLHGTTVPSYIDQLYNTKI
jgi:hypothetical protein